jgi:hypothetical protein
MVINNLVTDFLIAIRTAAKTMKLASMEVLRVVDVERTTLGRIFETVGIYRDQSDYVPANQDVHEHIANTLQRAYKHALDAQSVRGARLDDMLLKNITEATHIVIGRVADAITHVNNATANKTVKNEIVRTLFEVYGLLTGHDFVGCFKPQYKPGKLADAAAPAIAAPIVDDAGVDDADAKPSSDLAAEASSAPDSAPPPEAKKRRSVAKK